MDTDTVVFFIWMIGWMVFRCHETQVPENLNRMKADLDRAVGLQPVKDFEVIRCT